MATAQVNPSTHVEPLLPIAHKRIPSLDGLRAISIAFVLIGHFCHGYQRFFTQHALINRILISLGYFGVKIFFVISGYLITLLMLNEEKRAGGVNLGQFYIRRAFRILPAAIAFMVAIFIYEGSAISLQNKILSFLFLENYATATDWHVGHLWSLGVEEQFYLLWPFLFMAWPRVRKKVLFLAIALVPIINVVMIRLGWPYWNLAFYSVADTIACGCLINAAAPESVPQPSSEQSLLFLGDRVDMPRRALVICERRRHRVRIM